MKHLILIGTIFCSCSLFAQGKKEKAQWKFHSINQLGWLKGESASTILAQTIQGFQHRSWFGGIGAGIDPYHLRGIPVFVDIRKEWGSEKNAFFLYGDAGIHFAWLKDNQKDAYAHGVPAEISNGFYTDIGLGYKAKIFHRN